MDYKLVGLWIDKIKSKIIKPFNCHFKIDNCRENNRTLWVVNSIGEELYGIKIFYSPEFNEYYISAIISISMISFTKLQPKDFVNNMHFKEYKTVINAVNYLNKNINIGEI